jgi:predicted transcriptional regulator
MTDEVGANLVELATELTIAWLGNASNRVSADEVPAFLRTMHQTVRELTGGEPNQPSEEQSQAPEAEYTPAVSVRKSLGSKDHIVSLIDGKPYKTLRRHLSANGLTPEQYRERYKLRPDYPMVAENYSAARSDMARKIGLGSKGRGGRPTLAGDDAGAAKPKRKGRPPKDAAPE